MRVQGSERPGATARSLGTRRAWFAAIAGVAGAAALAACGTDQSAPGGAGQAPPAAGGTPRAQPTVAGSGIVAGPFPGEAKALTGAGATFPAALYSSWFETYYGLTQVRVNYQSIGSGGGIKAISDMTVDFGATDGPMTDQQLSEAKGGPIYHIPTALGAVVATYNLPEVPASTRLRFTPETLAGIFLGDIKRWNDPKLKADNPNAPLPDKEITSVHRSDGSGTTYIFTDYLSAVSPKWKEQIGTSTTVSWPGGLGGRGNEGVAGEVKQNPYSLGYVEYIYAKQNKLGYAEMKNKSGAWIYPDEAAVSAAAAATAGSVPADLRASIVNADGATSYPISGFTWILAYQNAPDQAKAAALTRLLWWATHDAQRVNADLGYAPLPVEIIKKGEEFIKGIKVNGSPAFPNK
jgi:phosphate transport system substrate-binding protein